MARKGLGKDKTMEVKKLAIVFFLVLFLCPGIKAQELTVKSFREAGYDLAARTQVRKDINGGDCALLKVQLVASGAQFDGNVIGDISFKINEYWVYMSQGSKRLKVYHPNFLPLEVTFSDYGIDHLESKCTYVLTLLRSDVQQGNQHNLQVVRSVDPSLDMEAKRVVSSMPHWIPGKQNGSDVRVRYTVPVTFKL